MSFIENFFKRPNKPPKPTPVPVQPVPTEPYIPSVPTEGTYDVKRITLDHHNVEPIGMSYWRNINQHAGSEILEICLSIDGWLTTFMIDKRTLEVLSERSLGIQHTGEGINYSRKYSDMLFYGMNREYYLLNTKTLSKSIVWSSIHNLWQVHTDYNESIFSAEVRDSDYNGFGWGLSTGKVYEFKGRPDECQIDKSGDWLVIKEENDNRIIKIATGAERILKNADGAAGHSDNGFNCILGENDYADVGGALESFDFYTAERRRIFQTGTWNMGYISLTSLHPNLPMEAQWGLLSSADGRLILVKLDGSQEHQVITSIPITNDYPHRVKANLCPNGEFAIWTATINGRRDAYIVRIPRR